MVRFWAVLVEQADAEGQGRRVSFAERFRVRCPTQNLTCPRAAERPQLERARPHWPEHFGTPAVVGREPAALEALALEELDLACRTAEP